MYGMIHKSVRDMILAEHGEQQWLAVAEAVGVGEEHLLSLEAYDDKIVYDLVSAAADLLNTSGEEILKSFGRHFVVNTLPLGYQSLVETYGRSSFELLSNINRLHATIKATFSDYQPPLFSVEYLSDNCIDLLYVSERAGLTPFVVGLIQGLSEYYHESLSIQDIHSLETDIGERTRFRIVNQQAE